MFSLPAQGGQGSRRWACIGVCEDYLIAGASFVRHSPLLKPPGEKPDAAAPFVDWSASKTLVVMNRYDGKVLWSAEADHGFIHNGIAAGGGMVFCLDAVPPYVKRNARQDAEVGQASRLLAMDLRTGRVVWDNRDSAFGTWLSFSEPFGVLVQAYRKSGDMLRELGDRKAENGTLWLEYPIVGGSSAELDMAVAPEELSWFRRHSSRLRRSDIPWDEASGAKGLRSVQVRVSGSQNEPRRMDLGPPAGYTVHLHFMEPEDKKAGERRFDVALNGRTVLEDFDIVAEAGSPNVGIVRTFQGIQTSAFVTISLTPTDASSETILCGIEIVGARHASPLLPNDPMHAGPGSLFDTVRKTR